ncbi:MAG: hypothetical protein NVS4B6_22690 [Mycobacterium sp.]
MLLASNSDSLPTTAIGTASRLDEEAFRVAHYEGLAAQAAYPRLLAALVDLYEGRGCTAVQGSARVVVAKALGLKREPEPSTDLVLENYGSGFAWLRRAGS